MYKVLILTANIKMVFQIAISCNVTAQSSSQPNKRSLNEQSVVEHKRATSIPNVGLNSSLFDELENKFTLLDQDVISTG